MSEKIKNALMVLAFGCFALATVFSPGAITAETRWYRRVHFGWLGLVFWSATLVF